MKLIEYIIKKFGPKRMLSTEKGFKKALESRKKENKYKLPNIKFKSQVSKEVLNDCDVYKFSIKETNRAIIFIHGGAYVNEASPFHIKLIDKVCIKTGVDIYLPIYPLAPNHTFEKAYELVLGLYKKLLGENKEIILMGDSAGGGFSLAFTEYLNELNLPIPSKLILICPWLDISMSNKEIEVYENIDPMLTTYSLKEAGKLWAGDLDLKDYKVSPIYGKLKNLPETFIFVGTKELLYPDICLLHKKLKDSNIKVKLIIEKNAYHDYPLYPVKIGRKARGEIVKIINE